jgi:hypothetical protein
MEDKENSRPNYGRGTKHDNAKKNKLVREVQSRRESSRSSELVKGMCRQSNNNVDVAKKDELAKQVIP